MARSTSSTKLRSRAHRSTAYDSPGSCCLIYSIIVGMSTTRIFRHLPWEGRKEVSAQLYDSRNSDWKSSDRNWRAHAPEVMFSWISPADFRKTLMESQRAWCVCAPRRFVWTGFALPSLRGRITFSFLHFLLHHLHRSRCRLLHTWAIFGVGFLNCAWNIASTLEMILM